MYPNLEAEQKRQHMSNAELASILGMKISTLSYKKSKNRFLADECFELCKLFNCSFDYLFSAMPATNYKTVG